MSSADSRTDVVRGPPGTSRRQEAADVREMLRAFRAGSPGGRWSVMGLVLAGLTLAAGGAAPVLQGTAAVVVGQWAMVAAPLAAAAACFGARAAAPPEGRATWLILGIGTLLAAAGQALYARALLLDAYVAFPSVGFHLVLAFHFAFAEGAVLALRPAHEGRLAGEIALDGMLVLLGASAVVLRAALDPALTRGILDLGQATAVLVGQMAVAASLLFVALLVLWRDTALAGPVVDGLLVAALFFAFGNLLLAFGVEQGAGTREASFDLMRLAGWLTLFLTAGLATVRPHGAEATARRERVARRARQLIIPAAAVFLAAWAVDASRRDDVTVLSIAVVGAMGVVLALRIGAALFAVEQESAERRRAESWAARARLRAVTAQMNPHFLFNALHSLSALVRRDTREAERALERLGGLLRYGLDSGEDAVALRQEWAFARDFLEMEALRLGPRLSVEAEIAPEAMEMEVPPFIIQPLVENAVRHGVSPFPEGGRVAVRVRVEGDRLVIEVEDSGPGAPPEGLDDASGVGVRGVRAQLEGHFGADWAMESEQRPGGGFLVRLTMPADRD